ncbi:uncharacterized protein LOC142227327 [Haematobia irritans]|uniref:uncharacterized protein LOC142227327 n=1 Tax=Haematobia irritans TaxID=7368 RepID=UPI003F4F8EF9
MKFPTGANAAICLLQFLFIFVVRAPGNLFVESAVGLYGPDRYEGLPEICLQPMDFGYCRAKLQRYYFDIRRMKCTMFYWGGCAGNENNFKSMDECNDFCSSAYENTNSIIPQKRERSESQPSSNYNANTNIKSNALNSRGSSISKPNPPKFAVKNNPIASSYRDNVSSSISNNNNATSRSSNAKTFNVNPPQKELKYPSTTDELEDEDYDE